MFLRRLNSRLLVYSTYSVKHWWPKTRVGLSYCWVVPLVPQLSINSTTYIVQARARAHGVPTFECMNFSIFVWPRWVPRINIRIFGRAIEQCTLSLSKMYIFIKSHRNDILCQGVPTYRDVSSQWRFVFHWYFLDFWRPWFVSICMLYVMLLCSGTPACVSDPAYHLAINFRFIWFVAFVVSL